MDISPYIAHSAENPAHKIFFTAEDILFDMKLSFHEKRLLLKLIGQAENGLIHATRN